jgi:hypothetical protein
MQIPLTSNTLYEHVTGIEGRKTGSNTGVLDFEAPFGSVVLNGCIARDGGRHNALLPSGSIVNNCEFLNGYDNEATIGDALLVFHEHSTTRFASLPLTVINSVFQMNQPVTGNGSAISIISHTDDPSSMGNVFLDNDWYISKNGVYLGGWGFANVASPTIANRQYGSQISGLASPYENVNITNSQVVSYSGSPFITFETAGVTLSIDNSKFCGNSNGQGFWRVVSANNLNISITNSQAYIRYPSGTYQTMFYLGDTGTTLNLSNDDFGANLAWLPIEDFGTSNTFSNAWNETSGGSNIYESGSGTPQWYFNGTHYSTLTAWQAAVAPADANATLAGGTAYEACKLPDSFPEVQ